MLEKLLLSDLTTLDTDFRHGPCMAKTESQSVPYPGWENDFGGPDPFQRTGNLISSPFLPPKLDAEKEESLSEEEPERFYKEGVYEKDLPLVDLWNASDFHCTRRSAGRLQTLEESCQLIRIVMDNRTQLWWRKHLHIDLLNPEGLVAVSTIELEVTGVQLLGCRQTSHVMSHHIHTWKEFLYFEDGQEVDVTTTFEGFVEAGMRLSWSCSNTDSTFPDPLPRSPHTSPPSPPFEEDFQDEVGGKKNAQVPLMQSYFAYKGINDFEGKLAALRNAFEDLIPTSP
ncbi:uncharacterized protein LOC124485795 [Hypomesus transpacificus]|uniref:uncharacterized protein LOC124485795 n=1 Tax=Hypomesus transpacificus TaxID=137520 RepID=UPI001F0728B2|nr:uncharacterized protein LOC124485795 [Hypomesus transpacificus]